MSDEVKTETKSNENKAEEATANAEQLSEEISYNEESQTSKSVSNESSQDDEKNVLSKGLADGSSDEFKWYIAHALTGQENKVGLALKERIINQNLTEYFAEISIPEETVTSVSNGRKRTIKKKFFPGYIFLKMIMSEKTWHLVKNTDKVTGFIGGTSGRPVPISDEEAEMMTSQGNQELRRAKASSQVYSEGDSVKVIEGPFASFIGTVEHVNDKGKIKVNVSIFGRPTPVELDTTQVEKA